MIKYLQLPFRFDSGRIREEMLHINVENWKLHFQKLQYEGDWSALPLRSPDGSAGNIHIAPVEDTEYKDTLLLDQCPYIRSVLAQFHCPLKSVRLLKLNAGAIIKEHKDEELRFEDGMVRIHIPVTTDEKVELYLDNERLQLQEGECWYMNFNLPHRISNFSNIDRVHLVIDARVNEWLTELFAGDDILNRKDMAEPDPFDIETKKTIVQHFREMNTAKSNELADALEKEIAELLSRSAQ